VVYGGLMQLRKVSILSILLLVLISGCTTSSVTDDQGGNATAIVEDTELAEPRVTPENNTVTSETSLNLNVNFYERVILTKFLVDGSQPTLVKASEEFDEFTVELTDLAEGKHNFEFSAEDQAGNTISQKFFFTIDTLALTLTLEQKEGFTTTDKTPSFKADFNTEVTIAKAQLDGEDIEMKTDDNKTFTYTPSSLDSLAVGGHTFEIEGEDVSGEKARKLINFVVETTTDNSPPIISSVALDAHTDTTATITWTTDEESDSKVSYGTSSSNLNEDESRSLKVTSHSITLIGLTADKKYYYKVSSSDDSGNTAATQVFNFETKLDATPPERVSGFLADATGISFQVNLTWNANDEDDLDNYKIYWSKDSGLRSEDPDTVEDFSKLSGSKTKGETYTFYLVTGLDSNKWYFAITACDDEGNCANLKAVDEIATDVNTNPTLSLENVSPSSGDTSTTFNFSIRYKDNEDDSPSSIYVEINNTNNTMAKVDSSCTDYFGTGCYYYDTLTLSSAGSYPYSFFADDGRGGIVKLSSGTLSVGNSAPSLSSCSVNASSFNSTLSEIAEFTVTYTDTDNDAGTVNVDLNGTDYSMSTGCIAYSTGCLYTDTVDSSSLSVGVYEYFCEATDGIGGSTNTTTATFTVTS